MAFIDYVRWVLHFCGGVLIYAALFYEDEEGKIQSKLEEAWVQLKDKQDASLSKTTIFLRVVAMLTGRGFDRLFGRRLLSFRFVIISVYLSLASLFLFIAVTSKVAPNPKFGPFSGNILLFFMFGMVALTPAFIDSKVLRILWWLIAFVIPLLQIAPFLLFVITKRGFIATTRGIGYVATPFVVSLACDLGYIVFARWSLRRIARIDRFLNIMFIGLANLVILAILILAPIFLGIEFSKYSQMIGGLTMFSFVLNSIDVVIASAALFVALLLLLDRFLWSAILRPLYAIQRFRLIKNKKALWGVGLALIFLPTQLTFHLLQSVLSKL